MITEEQKKALRAFDADVRQLGLDRSHWTVCGSIVMAARGIRAANDIDVIVSNELWKALDSDHAASEYEFTDGTSASWYTKIMQHSSGVSCCALFFYGRGLSKTHASVRREEISGVRFQQLDDLIATKKLMGRPKDLADIELIRQWRESRRQG